MEEKEKLLKEIQGLIADSTKESVKKADLEARVEEINKQLKALNEKPNNNDEVKSLKEAVDKLLDATKENAAAIKAMAEVPSKKSTEKPKSFKEALMSAVMEKKEGFLTEKNDDYGKRLSMKDYFTERGHNQSPVFKIAVDLLESNIVGSNVSTVRLAELDAQRVGIPLTIYPHVTDWMPSKAINRPYMSLLVVYTYVDGAGTKTEGSASAQSSFLLKTVEFKSFYIATYFTLSDETLDDLDEAMSEIAATGPDKILDNIDSQLLGTSGDDSSALAGLFTANKHTDFASATTYADTVASANKVDAIATMKRQAQVNKYKPDALLVNPQDVLLLAAEKDQLDNSKVDRRVVFNAIGEPSMVAGLRIIQSEAVTANTCAVVDSKQLMIGKRKDMTMEVGYNGTDLTEGQKTVVIKARLAFGVRDKAAVIYCSDLAAAVSDINIE